MAASGTRVASAGTAAVALALIASCGGPAPPSKAPGVISDCRRSDTAAWTILMFMNGDNSLQADLMDDFDEIAAVPDSADVNVVMQFDRYDKAPRSNHTDETWTQTLRFRMRHGMTPTQASACEDLGEANMGSDRTLHEFIEWGIPRFPAAHYAVIISSHGNGWQVLTVKHEPSRWFLEPRLLAAGASLESRFSSYRSSSRDDHPSESGGDPDVLFNREVQDALTGRRVDVIGFDACLMAMIETAYAMRQAADWLVGSENLEPGRGWNYTQWLSRLVADARHMDGEALSRLLVDSYEHVSLPNSDQTLSAVKLGTLASLSAPVNDFAKALVAEWPTEAAQIRNARGSVQKYEAFQHIDLEAFAAQVVSLMPNSASATRGKAVLSALDPVVPYHFAGTTARRRYGSRGLAIYFPGSAREWEDDEAQFGPGYVKGQTQHQVQFVDEFCWADFLYLFNGVPIPPSDACR